MEVIPDGSPLPPGRWNTPNGGFNSRNGGWGLGAGTVNPSTGQVLTQGAAGDANHEGLAKNTSANHGGFSSLITGQDGTGGTSVGGGKPSYNDLLAKFKAANPTDGGPGTGENFGDRFNTWVGQSGLAPQGWTDSTTPSTVYGNPGGQGGLADVPGQNYRQDQTGHQGGAFDTSNVTNLNQNRVTGSSAGSNTSGTNFQSGSNKSSGSNTQDITTGQKGDTSGKTDYTGSSVTGAVDTLGFGGLLKGAAPGVQASDAERSAFLSDVMKTGGSQFGSQVDQAVRNASSGPGLTGAGDSARARAAGYAGAQVARNNLDQRLGAAKELAGPTGLQTLSTAANPYIGQKTDTSGSQVTSGTSNLTGFQNLVGSNKSDGSNESKGGNTGTTDSTTSGFDNLISKGNENQSGTATGDSASSARGVIPQAQQVSTGGGGCVLCTVATELGLFRNLRVLRRVIDFKMRRQRFSSASRGYFFMFTPVAVYLLSRPKLARLLYPIARAVVYEELRLSGRRLPLRVWAWIVHWAVHSICAAVGKLPVPKGVQSPLIETLAKKYNIWFPL